MSQLAIVILSGSAIFLVGSVRRDVRRWGYICGMASQPLYFHATWTAGQWGMFMLAFWFTFGWSRGAWNHWKAE